MSSAYIIIEIRVPFKKGPMLGILSSMSLRKREKSRGEIGSPWGVPMLDLNGAEIKSPALMYILVLLNISKRTLQNRYGIERDWSLANSKLLSILSKAF